MSKSPDSSGSGQGKAAGKDALAKGTVQGAGLPDNGVLALQVGEARVKASRNLLEIVQTAWAVFFWVMDL